IPSRKVYSSDGSERGGKNVVSQRVRYSSDHAGLTKYHTYQIENIAGEATKGTVTGQILVNGEEIQGRTMREISGFVFQDDLILPTMTVREAITMSATLRLPNTVTPEERDRKVNAIIEELGLTKCAETIIGDSQTKGVSGGERKRCAVAMEMITDPHVLYLDEPTSGLDTFTSFSVIQTLKNVAHTTCRTIVATIHQPSSETFHLFDDLMLLAEGRIMYLGPSKYAVNYFKALGYPCPRRSNPADFFFYKVVNNEENSVAFDAMGVGSLESLDKEHDGGSPAAYESIKLKQIAKPVEGEGNRERIERLLGLWGGSEAEKAMLTFLKNPVTGGIPKDARRVMTGPSKQ
ncbi:ATP-binding cassette sub- G member 1, partial [Blyttiomyces sp. JEL0837]